MFTYFGMRPNQSLSDLMQSIKGSSSKWTNDRKFLKGRFEWQEDMGLFLMISRELVM